jgi:hypothetical protein
LRQILIGRPDGDFSTFLSFDARCAAEASASSASSSIIGQTTTPIAASASSKRMKLREQRGLDAVAGLVVRPKPIAKRLDDVIGGDAEVRRRPLSILLQQTLQHADDSAVGAVLSFVNRRKSVEVTKEFVRSVD